MLATTSSTGIPASAGMTKIGKACKRPIAVIVGVVQYHYMPKQIREIGLFPFSTIFRRMLPVGLAAMLMLALIAGAWDLQNWSGIPLERVIAFAAFLFTGGMVAAALLEWESHKERRRWTVHVSGDLISIIDEKGKTTDIPTSALEMVVAIASQSAWRGDLDIALFDEGDEPLILFPLVASGGDSFVEWLSCKGDFRSNEFSTARSSTHPGGHVIWTAY